MGISCKPFGKFQSLLRKLDNELEKEKKLVKESKIDSNKRNKNENNEEM